MAIAHNRLSTLGIAALTGVAILGWVREPERHFGPADTGSRVTFQSPQAPVEERSSPEFSGRVEAVESSQPPFVVPSTEPPQVAPAERNRKSAEPARRKQPVDLPASAPTAPRASTAPETGGRHDFPETRTRPEVLTTEDRSEQAAVRAPDPVIDQSTPQSQPAINARQPRSTRKSAMIVAGAAAAGAAIGGLSGGRKGAAIGALSAGAGGYLYDRMTRNRGASANGASASPNASSQDRDDEDASNRFYSRFSTPGFAR